MYKNTGPKRPTTTDTPITTHPLAMIVHGHCWLADLHDPDAPIWVDREDARPAWQIEHLDATCECDSRSAVQQDERGCIITTGHADGCGWYLRWLQWAGLSTGLGIVGAPVTAVA